ncbi:MAG: transporter substrate-binding domain-containing protein [Dysgonamonadaceae bacterium]|jgi:membrane-bound lytic murein transglycosylase MltF|nr:transporter substrate-binding domain-containing protein [Dysgonamonadaceae bacterium]
MKRRLLYSIVTFGIFLILLIWVNVTGEKNVAGRDYYQIKQEGILNIVTEYNSVDYYVTGDTIAGIQYELCKYIEKRSGLHVEIFLANNMEACIKGLENHTYDIIARSIPITNENKDLFLFTVPVAQSKQVLVQRKPVEGDTVLFIRNQLDLSNKEIHVPKNSAAILRLRNLSDEIAEPIHIKETEQYSREELIYRVACKEIDYAVVDRELALKNSISFPEIDVKTDIGFTQFQAWAVRKTSPALLDSLNVWISDYGR